MIHLTKFSATAMVTLSAFTLCLLSCFVLVLCIREGSELTRRHLELSTQEVAPILDFTVWVWKRAIPITVYTTGPTAEGNLSAFKFSFPGQGVH